MIYEAANNPDNHLLLETNKQEELDVVDNEYWGNLSVLCRAARSRRLSCPTLTVTLHPPGPRLSRIPGVTQSSALGQEHSLSHVILNRNVRGLSGGNYLGMRAPRLQQPQPRGHVHMSQDRSTHERSDVPDERLCDASERFARFAGTSMRVPVHGPCIMRTRCVSVDCRQRYPSEISTWYWFCPPAARGASCSPSWCAYRAATLLALEDRQKTVLAAPLPGTLPPFYTRARLLQPQLSTESAAT